MSVRVSQEEFTTEFQRWSAQFFKQWRDEIAACRRQLEKCFQSSPNISNDHNQSINPHDSTTPKLISLENLTLPATLTLPKSTLELKNINFCFA
jgi:hypothetical protein